MLFVFYYLRHEFRLTNYFFTDKSVSFHGGNASTDRSQQFYTENECVARNYFLAKLHTVYFHEVGRVTLCLVYRIQYEQTAYLRHCFYLKNTRHDRFLREVSLEE